MSSSPKRRTSGTDPSDRLIRAIDMIPFDLSAEDIATARQDYLNWTRQYFATGSDGNRWVDLRCHLRYRSAIRDLASGVGLTTSRLRDLKCAYALVVTEGLVDGLDIDDTNLTDDELAFREQVMQARDEIRNGGTR